MYELYELNRNELISIDTKCKWSDVEVSKITSDITGKSFEGIVKSFYWKLITRGEGKAYIIRDDDMNVIHSSIVISNCYKYPFLKGNQNRSIVIGPCSTSKLYRGQNLYPYVLSEIIKKEIGTEGMAFMIVDDKNIASIKGIKKIGFNKKALIKKDRIKRYVLDKKCSSNASLNEWKYYNHAMIPIVAPHEVVNLEYVSDNTIFKIKEKPLFVRWTSDFDCGYRTNWWYCIKDDKFDINLLNSKKRHEINKGKKNFKVREINPEEYQKEMYRVTVLAYESWPEKYRPQISEKSFNDSVKNWVSSTTKIIAAFSASGDNLEGYACLSEEKGYVNFKVLRVNPEFEKFAINAAIVNRILEYYSQNLTGKFYILDGERNINHVTNFQKYLEKYFGFRKAYCYLHIKYRPIIKVIITILYPFRKLLANFDELNIFHQINSVLKMEEIIKMQR